MENKKNLNRLRRLGVVSMRVESLGIKFKMIPPQFQDKFPRIVGRLTDLITMSNILQNKKELFKLLADLKKLFLSIQDYLKKVKRSKRDLSDDDMMEVAYLMGKISSINLAIRFIIDRIVHFGNKLSEEEKKQLEEAGKDESLSYVG